MAAAASSEALPPYPEKLRASPGNALANLSLDAFVEKHPRGVDGADVVVALRQPESIEFVWAPAEIVTYGACGSSLVELTPAELLEIGKFSQPNGKKALKGREKVVVCAPPNLDGGHSALLADQVWKETFHLETAIASLEALSITASWTPERAAIAVSESFQRLIADGDSWRDASTEIEMEHPRGDWNIYYDGTHQEFETNITLAVQKFARAERKIRHRYLPLPCDSLIDNLMKIAEMAQMHKDSALLTRVVNLFARLPEAIPFLNNVVILPRFEGVDTDLYRAALDALYREELLTVGAQLKRDTASADADAAGIVTKARLDSPFVFDLDNAHTFLTQFLDTPNRVWDSETAVRNLDTYVGGYLSKLDLSKSFITGSAAMSSVLRPQLRDMFATHSDYLACYYPAVYTVLDDAKAAADRHRGYYDRPGDETMTIKDCGPSSITAAAGGKSEDEEVAPRQTMVWSTGQEFSFKLRPGADVDIAVDAEGDEFDRIAKSHYAAICSRFPNAVLQRIERERSHMYRIVSASMLRATDTFREVEIYPASWREVCTHHVGMVRLAYTGATEETVSGKTTVSGKEEMPLPRFLMTVSCMISAIEYATPNYYYFSSRKTTPQEIMLKYAMRGYSPGCLPQTINTAILHYSRNTVRWNTYPSRWHGARNWSFFTMRPPPVNCIGDYNITALPVAVRAFTGENDSGDSIKPSS